MRKLGFAALFMLMTVACTTRMIVKKADSSAVQGLRYYLPKPILMVMPKSDGGVGYEWVYVPDASNAYAIDSRSYLAKHKVRVDVDDKGLLTKVLWNPNSTELASASLASAAEIQKKRIEVGAAAEQAAGTKAAAAKAAIDAAKAAVDAAQLEVDQIDAEIAELERQNKAEAANEARVRRAKAQAKLDAAQRHLEELQVAAGGAGPIGAGNDPNRQKTNDAGKASQYGPVLFRVEDTGTVVRLVPIAPQDKYETFKKPDAPTAPPPKESALLPTDLIAALVKCNGTACYRLDIAAAPAIASIVRDQVELSKEGADASKHLMTIGLITDGVRLYLKGNTPPGLYTLTVPYKRTAKSETANATIEFAVPAR